MLNDPHHRFSWIPHPIKRRQMTAQKDNEKDLILATGNRGKIAEITRHLQGLKLNVRSLLDIRQPIEIEETGSSYSENALIKAITAHKTIGGMALADDSGLEIDALNGEPGVRSARYGGAGMTDAERNRLVLGKLKGVSLEERRARFVCVAVIVDEIGRPSEFRGVLEGYIGEKSAGEEGFGYDPIFYLPDSGKSLAQLGIDIKNRISHRAAAMQQVRSCLESLLKGD